MEDKKIAETAEEILREKSASVHASQISGNLKSANSVAEKSKRTSGVRFAD